MLKGTGSRDRFHKVTQKDTYLGPKRRRDGFLNFSETPPIYQNRNSLKLMR